MHNAIGGPGTRVNDGVVGQCDGMEYRRLNAALPALGKMNPRWLRIGEHRDLRKRVLVSFQLKDTIKPMNSEGYGKVGGHKNSVDHHTGYLTRYFEGSVFWDKSQSTPLIAKQGRRFS